MRGVTRGSRAESNWLGAGSIRARRGSISTAGITGEAGITGSILNSDEIEGWVPRFAALDKKGRRALPGFEPGREDVALAGLIVVREVLRWAGQPALKVSTGGVREGRLLEMLRG